MSFAAANYNTNVRPNVRQRRFGGVSNSIIHNDDNKTKSLSTRRITDSDTTLPSSSFHRYNGGYSIDNFGGPPTSHEIVEDEKKLMKMMKN